METVASNSWRQPVNDYLNSGSSISIDWIRVCVHACVCVCVCVCISISPLLTQLTTKELSIFHLWLLMRASIGHLRCHIGLALCIWKVEKVTVSNNKSIFSLIVSEVKSEKQNIYKVTIWSFTWRSLKLIIRSGMHSYCFYFPLPEHSSSSAVEGVPDVPWAGILNDSTTDCSQAELCATNLGNFRS